jgi:DNA modification methylase
LQSLIDKLSNPDAVARVRLVRETKAAYEEEFPTAAKGKAQAAGANRAKGVTLKSKVTPFAVWLADQLDTSVGTVEALIRRAHYVPEEALAAVEGMKGVGQILEAIVAVRKKDPSADWRLVVENHVNPPQYPAEGKLHVMRGNIFIRHDAQRRLTEMADNGLKVDAVICDPPFGMRHNGKAHGQMEGDREGALWAVPLFARVIKPGRPVCLWCSGGTLGKWTEAVLDAGLTISALVRWDKGEYLNRRGQEVMLVAGHGLIDVPLALRTISVPTLPAGPERDAHPTPKPPALFEPIIEALTRPGETVLDIFAGTGVVGEVAVLAGRHYVGAEIVPAYADFAVARIKRAEDMLRDRRAA